jgi:hypothetical protein
MVQLRVGEDGEKLTKSWMKLSVIDAQAVFNAVNDKLERVRQGSYDSHPGEIREADSFTCRMAGHLQQIVNEIGYRGEMLTLERESRAEIVSRVETTEAGLGEIRAELALAASVAAKAEATERLLKPMQLAAFNGPDAKTPEAESGRTEESSWKQKLVSALTLRRLLTE